MSPHVSATARRAETAVSPSGSCQLAPPKRTRRKPAPPPEQTPTPKDITGHLSPHVGTHCSGTQAETNLHCLTPSANIPTHMDAAIPPLAALVMGAVEQEKARISRELHDELVQSLFAMKIECAWLSANLTRDPKAARRKVAAIQRLLEASAASLRRIVVGLRPPLLDEVGLAGAVTWLTKDFAEITGVACELQVAPGVDVRDPYASAAFRIVQESLTNIRKHAAARKAKVCVSLEGPDLFLSIQDDGNGFDATQPRRRDAVGLSGLRERARLLGGRLDVHSTPGQGTLVAARLPYPTLC